jgi:AraC-like DNA-binding protein
MTTVRLTSGDSWVQQRIPLLDLSIAQVEDVRSQVPAGWVGAEGFSPEFQLVLPYRGHFVWEVGRDEVVGDPNQALFVTAGEAFRMRQPLAGGYAELIVTPAEPLLEELARGETRDLLLHPLFRRRSRRLDPRLQLLRARFLSCTAVDGGIEPLAAEELVVRLLRAALDGSSRARLPARSSQRLVDRTKTFLSAELGRSLTLSEISRTVGASPGYLTQLFRDLEGVPLHRYLTQLRLSRALSELPHADDLTELAMDLGFSSHSHFSARFHQAFGLTPSEFRRGCRLRSPPLPV